MTVVEEFESSKELLRTINQIVEIREVGSYWTFGKIVYVESIDDWWYILCNNCTKKVTQAAWQFYCLDCDTSDAKGRFRYKVQVRVVDGTGNASFLIWDREGNELIGKIADELKIENDDQILPKEILNLVDMQVLFKIQIRNGQYGMKNGIYPVIKLIVDKAILDKYSAFFLENEDSDLFSRMMTIYSI